MDALLEEDLMRKVRPGQSVLFALFVFSPLLGLAQGYTELTGEYRLVPTDPAMVLFRPKEIAVPEGMLKLNAGRFVFKSLVDGNWVVNRGHYEIDDRVVTLITSTGLSLKFQIDDGRLSSQILQFEKIGRRGWNRRSDFPSLPHQESLVPAKFDIVGTWSVTGYDAHMEFDRESHFHFRGKGIKSEGLYSVQGDHVDLNWTQIDGEEVSPNTVTKTILIRPDGTFWIDNYHYGRE